MKQIIQNEFDSHLETAKLSVENIQNEIAKVALTIIEALKNGKKILLCGNGGSAADAQHIAAEFTGRYKLERIGLPAIAITTDTSALTAIGNDYGYDRVFDRQIEALAQNGDIIIGISTSGNSINVINALKLGQEMGCKTIGLSGRDGGAMNDICDVNVVVPSSNTPRIQEIHILIGHIICHIVDENYKNN